MRTKLLWVGWLVIAASLAAQPLQVVTTQPGLADLARRIGGEQVSVYSLTSGTEDIHLVSVRPSMLNRVRKADVFLQIGMSLEHSWVPALLDAARNPRVRPGGEGFINGSAGVVPMGRPASLSRAEGVDLHPEGNPHYNLDPERVRVLARNIAAGLSSLRANQAALFTANLQAFESELDAKMAAWQAILSPYAGQSILETHDTWIYFAERFGLKIQARLEPKPGVAPTAAHLGSLVEPAKLAKVRVVIAPRGKTESADKLAELVGARVLVLPTSSTAEGETAGWIPFMDHVVNSLAAGLKP